MNRTLFPIFSVALLLAGLAAPAPAAQRSFVASHGLDTNPCTLASPCRGFAAAVAAVDAGGEVIVLDSAGYGTVTISKSVSIIAPDGVYAGISVLPGQDGITVNAGAGDRVMLRGLTINGQGGNRGIRVVAGGRVHVERCAVSNMVSSGIQVLGGGAVSIAHSALRSNEVGMSLFGPTAQVYVADTVVSGNSVSGIDVNRGSLTLERVRIENNGGGMGIVPTAPTVQVLVRDSSFSGNTFPGITATAASGQVAVVTIERCSFLRNQDGVSAVGNGGTLTLILRNSLVSDNPRFGVRSENAGTRVLVTRSSVTGNQEGLSAASGGTLITYGNNVVAENTVSDLTGVTTAPLQ